MLTDRSLFSGNFYISETFLAVAGRVKQEVALGGEGSICIEKRTGGPRCGLTRHEDAEDRWSPDQF